FAVPMIMPNAAAAAVSQRLGWHGPCDAITTACAAGTHAIGSAAPLGAGGIREGGGRGGPQAPPTPTGVAGVPEHRGPSGPARGHARPGRLGAEPRAPRAAVPGRGSVAPPRSPAAGPDRPRRRPLRGRTRCGQRAAGGRPFVVTVPAAERPTPRSIRPGWRA